MLPYRSFAHSATGTGHRPGVPCQDYAAHYDDDGVSIAIVADGHGGAQYFRSDVGARLAAEIAMKSIRAFVAGGPGAPDVYVDRDGVYATRGGQKPFAQLVNHIVSTWREAVAADEATAPLREDARLEGIAERYRNRYLNDIDGRYVAQAYGATLVAVAVAPGYWFGLHIGDGRCEALFDDGAWAQPIPWDEKCFLNVTTSICDDDAAERARVWFGPTGGDARRPAALFVNSDGVDDSYSVDEEIKQGQLARLYRSVALSFAKEGFDATEEQLPGLAEVFAVNGSRDDVSIAGVVRTAWPEALVAELDAQREADMAARAGG